MLNNDYLSIKNCTFIRGLCALLILTHHVFGFVVTNPIGLMLLELLGVFIPALFFFYSGFGLMLSLLSSKDYLNGFIKHKFFGLLIIYFVAIIVYLFERGIFGQLPAPGRIINDLKNGNTFVPFSWYIITTLLFYLFFFISFRFSTLKKGLFILSFLVICYIIAVHFAGYGDWWYCSCGGFLLGCFYATKKIEITSFLKKKYPLWLLISTLLLVISIVSRNLFHPEAIIILYKLIRGILFCIWAIMISMIVPTKICRIQFFGTHSLEIYLYQGIAIDAVGKLLGVEQKLLFVTVTFIFTIVLSLLIHPCNVFLQKTIKKC